MNVKCEAWNTMLNTGKNWQRLFLKYTKKYAYNAYAK